MLFRSGGAVQKAQVGDCPIPLEPGEVPPIALSTEELVVEEIASAVPEQAVPASSAIEATPSRPVEAPVSAVAAAKPQAAQKPATAKAAQVGAVPSFDNASEYDFDFDGTTQPEKDVVVPEQDSMSDTLKALGWEEEEDK